MLKLGFLDRNLAFNSYAAKITNIPASILYKSTAGRYRPVSYPDGPITARCRFTGNAYWDVFSLRRFLYGISETSQLNTNNHKTAMKQPSKHCFKSTAGRYRPVSYPDGPITARCRFIKNAS